MSAIIAGASLVPVCAYADGPTHLKLPSPDDGVDLESWLAKHITGTEVVLDGPGGMSKWGAALAEALIMTPQASRIESLTIRYEEIGPEGAELLGNSSSLRALRRLDLSGHRIGDRGVEALAMSQLALVGLNLSHNDVGPDGVAALLGSGVTSSLEWLALDGNPLGADGAAAIARAKHVTKISSLSLDATRLGAEGAKALAAAKRLRPVELSLSSNAIGSDGADALAGSGVLASVERLDLDDNAIGAEGARALAESSMLASVQWLDLSRNDLGTDGARWIAAGSWPALTSLDLSSNRLGDDGAIALSATSGMPLVPHVYLLKNGIAVDGARALAASATFDRTGEVSIWGKVAHGKLPRDPEIARAVKAFRTVRRERESGR